MPIEFTRSMLKRALKQVEAVQCPAEANTWRAITAISPDLLTNPSKTTTVTVQSCCMPHNTDTSKPRASRSLIPQLCVFFAERLQNYRLPKLGPEQGRPGRKDV